MQLGFEVVAEQKLSGTRCPGSGGLGRGTSANCPSCGQNVGFNNNRTPDHRPSPLRRYKEHTVPTHMEPDNAPGAAAATIPEAKLAGGKWGDEDRRNAWIQKGRSHTRQMGDFHLRVDEGGDGRYHTTLSHGGGAVLGQGSSVDDAKSKLEDHAAYLMGQSPMIDRRSSSVHTAATSPGYYVVTRTGAVVSGPYPTFSAGEPDMIKHRGATVMYIGPGDDPVWAATKPKSFPLGSNTVNGSKTAANLATPGPDIERNSAGTGHSTCIHCDRPIAETVYKNGGPKTWHHWDHNGYYQTCNAGGTPVVVDAARYSADAQEVDGQNGPAPEPDRIIWETDPSGARVEEPERPGDDHDEEEGGDDEYAFEPSRKDARRVQAARSGTDQCEKCGQLRVAPQGLSLVCLDGGEHQWQPADTIGDGGNPNSRDPQAPLKYRGSWQERYETVTRIRGLRHFGDYVGDVDDQTAGLNEAEENKKDVDEQNPGAQISDEEVLAPKPELQNPNPAVNQVNSPSWHPNNYVSTDKEPVPRNLLEAALWAEATD